MPGEDGILGKNFLTEKVVKHWSRLPKEVVESLGLEVLKCGCSA